MEKLYYSISEVSEMLKVSASSLRFWEREFKQLKPHRTPKGTRLYTKEDVEVIKQIKFLTDDQKLTLQGAQKKLSQKKDTVSKQHEIVERLKKVKSELKGIIKALNISDSE